jgi:hypothetical protein
VQVLLKAVEEVGGIYLVTADHGNAEEMVKHDKNGNPVLLKDGQPQKLTAHTCAPVSSDCSLTSLCASEPLRLVLTLFHLLWVLLLSTEM